MSWVVWVGCVELGEGGDGGDEEVSAKEKCQRTHHFESKWREWKVTRRKIPKQFLAYQEGVWEKRARKDGERVDWEGDFPESSVHKGEGSGSLICLPIFLSFAFSQLISFIDISTSLLIFCLFSGDWSGDWKTWVWDEESSRRFGEVNGGKDWQTQGQTWDRDW